MLQTDSYVIPCFDVFREQNINKMVENKEKLVSDFLKKMRIGFDMKMVGDTSQPIMMVKMEGTMFKNEVAVLPVDRLNDSMTDMFYKISNSYSVERMAKEVMGNQSVNRFDEKYNADEEAVKRECYLVRIRLDGIYEKFVELEEKERTKALGTYFIKEVDKKNPLFTNKTFSFDLNIFPNAKDSNWKEISELFEKEMGRIGFKRVEPVQEHFTDGVAHVRISNPKRICENAIALRSGKEYITGHYEETFGVATDMRVDCFWSLDCKLRGESLSALNKVINHLPKHEILSDFIQYESIESLVYNQLKKTGYKDYMFSPNYKHNGKKIRNTKGLSYKEVEVIDAIEDWAKKNNIRNRKGYLLSYYAATERPKIAFRALFNEAKSKGFSLEKDKNVLGR